MRHAFHTDHILLGHSLYTRRALCRGCVQGNMRRHVVLPCLDFGLLLLISPNFALRSAGIFYTVCSAHCIIYDERRESISIKYYLFSVQLLALLTH